MGDQRHDAHAEELLAHSAWLRALALRLSRDADDADDLVQETWLASLRRSPDEREKVRPWLSKILLNAFRMRLRGDTRRSAREEASHIVEDGPAADVLVARAEMQRMLVDLVLKLDEPYRSTVLLHFSEGMSLADIARSQDVPQGTVRWRLKFALDRLRVALDVEKGGRKQWAVPLLAFSKGFLVAQKTSKAVAIAALLLLLLVVGGVILYRRGSHPPGSAESGSSHGGGGGGALISGHGGTTSSSGDSDEALPRWLAQPGVAARRIAGRVTFNGTPVAGAAVELASVASEAGLVAAPRKTTDASGSFDFGTQLAMEWSVRASSPGKTSATIELDLRDPTSRPAPDHLELRLGTCSAAIFGNVRDASGGPIVGARLLHLNVDGPAMGPTGSTSVPGGPSVITDDKGGYELCAEAKWPGWVSVDVSADGYGAIVFTGLVPGRMRVDFALVPEATINGRVVDAETGQPVPHAYVFVPRGAPGSETTAQRATFSDDAGKFKLDRVAPGPHVVFAEGAGYVSSSRGVPVTIDAGQTSAEIVIRLDHGSTIRGVVRKDEKPVAGAHVSFVGTDDVWRRPIALSQSDGSFVLTSVPRGTIQFTALPYDVTTPETFLVSLPEHDGVVLDVKERGAIVGHVTRDTKPVPGAHLFINGPNERELPPVIADADGHYEVHGLRAGPWTVAASSERDGAFGTEPKAVDVRLGKTSEVNIDLAFAASISGKVVDQTGAPVPGVAVLFRHTQMDDAGWAVTSLDGTFRAAMMTGGGQYTPTVRLRPLSMLALRPASGADFPLITVSDGGSAVTGIVLAVKIDHMTISGKVVDAAGGPVPDVRVVAELLEGSGEPLFWRGLQDPAATTDVEGKFAIDDLIDGTYALRARSSTGSETTQLGVRAGTTGLSIVLAEPGVIEGTLAGFKTQPQISAIREHSTMAPIFASPQGSAFVLRDLTPGTYVVSARSASEGATATVVVHAGTTAHATLTSKGSGIVAGHVIEFRSRKPVEGITCSALPRIENTTPIGTSGGGVATNNGGAFLIPAAPAGEVVIQCEGLRGLYSDGLRAVTLQPGKRLDVDVPVVGVAQPTPISGFGCDFVDGALVPTLSRIEPGGPAAVAGLQNGDVIVSVDGASITELSPQGVWILITNRTTGSKVKLGAMRAGKSVTAEVVLGPLR
ncbi:MAG TPA: sigma-70 family RNA polymerase sigma factor [Kofleriaceae bacterium]|nr:sigma-70 family RNA polymerase sigma factor [Kofleriaceae bacterium]